MTEGRLDRKLVKTTEMQVGVIYGGTLVGEVQVDKTDGKTIWRKRADGAVQQIKPHENCLWFIKRVVS